jgi:lysine 6-dehydrogenase
MSGRKFLVLGAGMMGRAIAFDLARSRKADEVTVLDSNKESCRSLTKWLGKDLGAICLDVKDEATLKSQMRDSDVVIVALPYRFNFGLMELAIDSGANFCDLGGNDDIVRKQLALDSKAKKAGVLCLPDCGLAPGLANVLAAYLASEFDSVDSLKIRVGGLPQNPKPPLNYQLVFSVGGLINEYKEKCKVLRGGKISYVEPMTELETLSFEKVGKLEAFTTSGGAAWLPEIYRDKIKTLDYKTIRYPGHCTIIKAMLDLGLANESEIAPGITPRNVLERQLASALAGSDKDMVLVRVSASGKKKGKKSTASLDIVDCYDEKNGITAMMRTTSYPTSIIAQMLADKKIKGTGVKTPEMCVPGKGFLKELAKRGISVKRKK